MKKLNQYYLQERMAVIVSLVLIFGQRSAAQTYFNINYTNSTNKYSVITEVASITFDENGGIVVRGTDNSVSTETLNLIKSITLDETSGGGTPLPVELVSFTVSARSLMAELRWKTATEKNIYGFEIERTTVSSQPSADRWFKAGFVEGNGNSNTPKEYSFTNKDLPPGTYAYRLKQINNDGKFTYSQELEVMVNSAPDLFYLEQNYPNPFNPSTVIGYYIPVNSTVSLKIYDMLGREVVTLVNEKQSAGWKEVQWNAKNLSSGIYLCRFESEGFVSVKKLSLLR